MKKIITFFIVLDLFIFGCFFLFYGPFNTFRDLIVTEAMTSKSHKYLARTFYSAKTIEKIMNSNNIEDFKEGSDTSQIVIGNSEEVTTYASSYEKEILSRNPGDLYKLIEFEYNGYDAYLVAIYDPTRVQLMQTKYLGSAGQTVSDMAKDNKALVAINGGGFSDPGGTGNGGTPKGAVIKNGKIAWGNGSYRGYYSGFNSEGVLLLEYTSANQAIKDGMKDGVAFGPFLIVNGKNATINGNGGWGINPRTVLAQRKDGIVLFLVIDGNGINKYNWSGRGGASMQDLIKILNRYGAYNAVNLDGGASTNLVIENKLWNKPCAVSATGERRVANGWMLK